jgi:hypothetical protein
MNNGSITNAITNEEPVKIPITALLATTGLPYKTEMTDNPKSINNPEQK